MLPRAGNHFGPSRHEVGAGGDLRRLQGVAGELWGTRQVDLDVDRQVARQLVRRGTPGWGVWHMAGEKG